MSRSTIETVDRPRVMRRRRPDETENYPVIRGQTQNGSEWIQMDPFGAQEMMQPPFGVPGTTVDCGQQ